MEQLSIRVYDHSDNRCHACGDGYATISNSGYKRILNNNEMINLCPKCWRTIKKEQRKTNKYTLCYLIKFLFDKIYKAFDE